MKSGWLSRPFDINDYSKGISWLLEDKDRLDQLSINAREYIKNKGMEPQTGAGVGSYAGRIPARG